MTPPLETAALKHVDRLYSFALRLTRNPAEAEDLVQETYVRALPRLGTVRQPAAVKTWLFRILYTIFASRWQAAQRGPVRVAIDEIDELGQQGIPGTFIPDPRVEFFSKFLPDDMDAAVKALPKTFRVPLLLQALEGMSYEQISEILDCPIGTVRSRLARARAALSVSLVQIARRHGFIAQERIR
jgi:RNA polymerase sigma-70 factor (ECF subfamily)